MLGLPQRTRVGLLGLIGLFSPSGSGLGKRSSCLCRIQPRRVLVQLPGLRWLRTGLSLNLIPAAALSATRLELAHAACREVFVRLLDLLLRGHHEPCARDDRFPDGLPAHQ